MHAFAQMSGACICIRPYSEENEENGEYCRYHREWKCAMVPKMYERRALQRDGINGGINVGYIAYCKETGTMG